MYIFDVSCSYPLWPLSYTAHKCNIFAWIFFQVSWCDNRLSSRRLCPQNSPEESLWPTTADPSLSMSWMSTSANYTTYLRRQERAWWGKHFLINVNATCVCSALVHRLIHFCVFLRMELCLMKILFWLKWGRMKTDDLDLTLRCVFGYWLHFLEDKIEYHKS